MRDVFPAQTGVRERGAQEALDYRLRRSAASFSPRARLRLRNRTGLRFHQDAAHAGLVPRALHRRAPGRVAAGHRGNSSPDLSNRLHASDEHATVFEFVNLAKKYGHRGVPIWSTRCCATFLRNRHAEPARSDFEGEDDYLGVRYSLPNWIVRSWRTAFPVLDLEAVCSAVNDPVQAAASVNLAERTRESVAGSFAERRRRSRFRAGSRFAARRRRRVLARPRSRRARSVVDSVGEVGHARRRALAATG